jgi:2-C-methyl-D-erythritol 4-phosphate cytidylyltransferase
VLVDAVIVAGGSSTRFGADKLMADLCGRPVLAWSIAAFAAAPSVGSVFLVSADPGRVEKLAGEWASGKLGGVMQGGARRRDSVEAGVRASKARYVAVHDGARPLVTVEMIERVIAAADGKAGAIAAVAATDTIKEVRDGVISGHPLRANLRAAQTPQVVLRQAWLDAAAAGDDDETDDAAMLSRLGLECVVVEGDVENLKVTRPLDLELARLIMKARTGGC